ncbi:hypothetical protein QMK19_36280 [Streptomyces sp. H10-C2]|uniref:hypothetical protein n=1 Tax=unclassified Streptomyces TaxID=2593676 RepID=UPI0022B026B0|nr:MULTISPECIES: hypothetical protein [unclassified Streptomyces]MCZ4102651.1 hypothetical protein [Streptomyces sp. H39-C1]MDJ0346379.1 hypothetical protein [Streptomyces sp. PH10-H1]MDJ0374931.1 hypothetical protein [Streptomyces sp. H10-C2]
MNGDPYLVTFVLQDHDETHTQLCYVIKGCASGSVAEQRARQLADSPAERAARHGRPLAQHCQVRRAVTLISPGW